MSARWRSWAPVALAVAFASVPFFPSFITLTSVQYPGVSVVPLPVALALLGCMLVLAAWAAVAIALPPREPIPLLRPLLLWYAAMVVAVIFGLNPRDGMVFVGIYGLSIVWYCGLVRVYDVAGAARATWWTIALATIVSCVLALAMVATRQPALQYAIAHGRAVGTFVLPGELAGYLIVMIPLAYGLTQVVRSRALRACAWVALGLGVVTMLATFSRTGWVGLACAIACFIGLRARGRSWLGAVAVVAGALVLVAALFNEHHNPSENFTRLSIWQAALSAIDRFPLTGVGPFGFSRIYAIVRLPDGDATAFHAHSMYLTFFAETGILGLTAFAWLLWSAGRELYERIRAAGEPEATLALALTAGLAGTLVQGLIDTVSVVIFGMFLPVLALALLSARRGAVDA